MEKKFVGAKIPLQNYKKIVKYVKNGYFLNISAFVREAITDKLREMESGE